MSAAAADDRQRGQAVLVAGTETRTVGKYEKKEKKIYILKSKQKKKKINSKETQRAHATRRSACRCIPTTYLPYSFGDSDTATPLTPLQAKKKNRANTACISYTHNYYAPNVVRTESSSAACTVGGVSSFFNIIILVM